MMKPCLTNSRVCQHDFFKIKTNIFYSNFGYLVSMDSFIGSPPVDVSASQFSTAETMANELLYFEDAIRICVGELYPNEVKNVLFANKVLYDNTKDIRSEFKINYIVKLDCLISKKHRSRLTTFNQIMSNWFEILNILFMSDINKRIAEKRTITFEEIRGFYYLDFNDIHFIDAVIRFNEIVILQKENDFLNEFPIENRCLFYDKDEKLYNLLYDSSQCRYRLWQYVYGIEEKHIMSYGGFYWGY